MDKQTLKKINELNESIEAIEAIKRHVDSNIPGSIIIQPICNADGNRLYISSKYGGSSTLSNESHSRIIKVISECLETELEVLKKDFDNI